MSDLPEPDIHDFETDDGVRLALHRFRQDRGEPVLLLHGASAGKETFTFPPRQSLADYLHEAGYDVWLLDWRGSKNIVESHTPQEDLRDNFHLDAVAKYDVRAAVQKVVKATTPPNGLAALGFCVGGGSLAQAIAQGYVPDVKRAVLMTLGLFYEVPIDGRIKAETQLLEKLKRDPSDVVLSINPRVRDRKVAPVWSQTALGDFFEVWPLRPHPGNLKEQSEDIRGVDILDTCNRVSFLYGEPYHEPVLVDAVHQSPGGLWSQFGGIPISTFVHTSRNVQDRQAHSWCRKRTPYVTAETRQEFRKLKRVTLITGALNRIWHRDSIDRMYEWLMQGSPDYRRFWKVVYRHSAHQDLLWGHHSQGEVFPAIEKALSSRGEAD